MTVFQSRLKELRKSKNVTQKKLGEYLGVTQNAVFNWESGKTEPNSETILKIAEFFQVTPSYLMGWENENTAYIADNLIKIMELKKITITELANISGISEIELKTILKNGRAPVSYIPLLADALNVKMAYFDEYLPSEITEEGLEEQLEFKTRMRASFLLSSLNTKGLEQAMNLTKLLLKIPEYCKKDTLSQASILNALRKSNK